MDAISTEFPQNNYRIDGLFNWLFGHFLISTPSIIYDWIDYLVHGRWYEDVNGKLIRQKSAYEKLFGRFPVPEVPLEIGSR